MIGRIFILGFVATGSALAQSEPLPAPGAVIPNGAPSERLVFLEHGWAHRTADGETEIAVTRDSVQPYPRVIDLDGDGVLDVVVNWGWDGGQTLEFFVWRSGTYRRIPWEEESDVGAPAHLDVDGDGDLDVIFGSADTGSFARATFLPLEYAAPRLLIFDSEALSLQRAPLACAPHIRDLTVSFFRSDAAHMAWRGWEGAAEIAHEADRLEAEACPAR